MTIFNAAQPWFGAIDDAGLDKMAPMFGPKAADLIANYRKEHPDYSPSHIANLAMGSRFVHGSYILADRKAEHKGAPVYMYRLTYDTKVQGGALKSPHTLEIPFMFNNVDKARVLVGPGKDPEVLAAMMSDAWLSFARTGKPSSKLLPEWPAYNTSRRAVMQFDVKPNVADDPEKGAREILSKP
jgi:para-nitrobenzyl esterase